MAYLLIRKHGPENVESQFVGLIHLWFSGSVLVSSAIPSASCHLRLSLGHWFLRSDGDLNYQVSSAPVSGVMTSFWLQRTLGAPCTHRKPAFLEFGSSPGEEVPYNIWAGYGFRVWIRTPGDLRPAPSPSSWYLTGTLVVLWLEVQGVPVP